MKPAFLYLSSSLLLWSVELAPEYLPKIEMPADLNAWCPPITKLRPPCCCQICKVHGLHKTPRGNFQVARYNLAENLVAATSTFLVSRAVYSKELVDLWNKPCKRSQWIFSGWQKKKNCYNKFSSLVNTGAIVSLGNFSTVLNKNQGVAYLLWTLLLSVTTSSKPRPNINLQIWPKMTSRNSARKSFLRHMNLIFKE